MRMHGLRVTACGSLVARMRVLETYANQPSQAGTVRELLATILATDYDHNAPRHLSTGRDYLRCGRWTMAV